MREGLSLHDEASWGEQDGLLNYPPNGLRAGKGDSLVGAFVVLVGGSLEGGQGLSWFEFWSVPEGSLQALSSACPEPGGEEGGEGGVRLKSCQPSAELTGWSL